VVDTEVFQPASHVATQSPVLGWIGTHSTFPYLESIFPALSELARDHSFRLKVVGAGRDEVTVPGVEVENLPWSLERELADFQSIDIGLYPINASLYSGNWRWENLVSRPSSMAVGVPCAAAAVGGSACWRR
jgi:hypothetical protein